MRETKRPWDDPDEEAAAFELSVTEWEAARPVCACPGTPLRRLRWWAALILHKTRRPIEYHERF